MTRRPAWHRWTPGRGHARAAACFLTAAIVAVGTTAHAQEAGYSVSASGTTTSYPGQRLSAVYVFNTLDLAAGPLRVWASVPFVRQWSSTAALDPATGAAASVDQATTGFADPLLRVDLLLYNDVARAVQVAVSASLKPSVVDAADGLGSGETDVAFGGSVFKALGRSSVFADLLFWKYGDPEGVDYADSLSYSIGVGRLLGRRWSAMATLSGFSAGIGGTTPPLQLNLAAVALTSRKQSIAITAGVGLTSTASDFSIGTSWRASF